MHRLGEKRQPPSSGELPLPEDRARATARSALDCVAVALGASLVLCIAMVFIDVSRLHVGGLGGTLNDQLDYISAARNLVDSGVLASTTIYPSTLSQSATREYVYMPGHFLALAASYRLLGFGPLQSTLPNMISFVAAAVLVFLAGRRLYNRQVGFLAAFLFTVLPANVFFAETAMAELTLVAVGMAAFAGFLWTPSRWRPVTGPALLVLPFVFRETAALLVIPMVALVWLENGDWKPGRAVLLAIASIALLTVVFRMDFSAGRPELNAIQYDDALTLTKYQDATISPHPGSAHDLLAAVSANLCVNVRRLITLVMSDAARLEGLSMIFIVAATIVAAAYGLMHWRDDPFPVGAAALATVLLALILTLYTSDGYRGLRSLLFAYPLLALCLAQAYTRSRFAIRMDPRAMVVKYALSVVLVAAAFGTTAVAGQSLVVSDAEDDAAVAFMRSVGHDDGSVLVAPWWLAMLYMCEHYPVRWSFVPTNVTTLELLRTKFDVGTVILQVGDPTISLTPADLERTGLLFQQEVVYEGQRYLVFKGDRSRSTTAPLHAPLG